MTTTARELFEEWYSMCSFNSGDTKYACSEAWRQAFERGRESVLSRVPSADETIKQASRCASRATYSPAVKEDGFISGAEWIIAKLKEPT